MNEGDPLLTGMMVSSVAISLGGVFAGMGNLSQNLAMYAIAALIVLGTITVAGDPNK
jgi:hypothetical protein